MHRPVNRFDPILPDAYHGCRCLGVLCIIGINAERGSLFAELVILVPKRGNSLSSIGFGRQPPVARRLEIVMIARTNTGNANSRMDFVRDGHRVLLTRKGNKATPTA